MSQNNYLSKREVYMRGFPHRSDEILVESQNNYLSKREVYNGNEIERVSFRCPSLKITTSQRERFIIAAQIQ